MQDSPHFPRKNLRGVSLEGEFWATDHDGVRVDPSKAIFPILKVSKTGKYSLVGTGFFVGPEGIFATASHVMDEFIADDGSANGIPLIIQMIEGDSYVQRRITSVHKHPRADICIGRVISMKSPTRGKLENPVATLSSKVPDVGEILVTYAYPRSVFQPGEVREACYLWGEFFKGEVQEHFLQGRDSVMLPGPCFQTSIFIHGGASGGPVFNSQGLVVGVNSTGYEDEGLSFITPLYLLKDLKVDGILTSIDAKEKFTTVAELIKVGMMSFDR